MTGEARMTRPGNSRRSWLRTSSATAADPRALAAFATLIGERPGDALAQYHLKRLLNGCVGTRIEMA
jgi:hypothetical protein